MQKFAQEILSRFCAPTTYKLIKKNKVAREVIAPQIFIIKDIFDTMNDYNVDTNVDVTSQQFEVEVCKLLKICKFIPFVQAIHNSDINNSNIKDDDLTHDFKEESKMLNKQLRNFFCEGRSSVW